MVSAIDPAFDPPPKKNGGLGTGSGPIRKLGLFAHLWAYSRAAWEAAPVNQRRRRHRLRTHSAFLQSVASSPFSTAKERLLRLTTAWATFG